MLRSRDRGGVHCSTPAYRGKYGGPAVRGLRSVIRRCLRSSSGAVCLRPVTRRCFCQAAGTAFTATSAVGSTCCTCTACSDAPAFTSTTSKCSLPTDVTTWTVKVSPFSVNYISCVAFPCHSSVNRVSCVNVRPVKYRTSVRVTLTF